MSVPRLSPCRSTTLPIPRDRTSSTIANLSSSPIVPTSMRCAKWCRNRCKWPVTRSRTSSSACRTPPASATTRKPVRSFRCGFVPLTGPSRRAATYTPCISTTMRRSPADARSGAFPKSSHESETLVCTLHFGSVLCVSATMGYKHHELDREPLLKSLAKPSFMIKIIPHVDCSPRICELVRYYLQDVTLKGAWRGPAALQLFEHAQCDVARLPVHEVVSASHYVTDLTLGLGEVVFDYLK